MAFCGRLAIGLPMNWSVPERGGLPTRRRTPSCPTLRRRFHFHAARPWKATYVAVTAATPPYFSTGRSTRSNSAAWRVKPRSVGCEPSTVASPSSPSRLAPSR